jgi:hypothetical protein
MSISQRLLIAILLVAHTGLALFLQEWMQHYHFNGPAIVIGIGIAQVNLVAFWGALAAGPVIQRLPWAALMTVVLWYAIVLGGRLDGDGLPRSESLLLGLILIGGVLAAMTPMWIARIWLKSRLVAWEFAPPTRNRHYDLWQLLIGITLLSVTLAFARVVLPPGETRLYLDQELQLLLPVAVVVNFATALPTIWLSLKLHPIVSVLLLLVGVPLYAVAIATGEAVTLSLLHQGGGGYSDLAEMIGIFWVLNIVQFWTIGVTLVALRYDGFRLAREDSGAASELPGRSPV